MSVRKNRKKEKWKRKGNNVLAPTDRILLSSNRVFSTFELTPLKHRQIGVSRINKYKFLFSLFPSISFIFFFFFVFVNFSFFIFSSCFVLFFFSNQFPKIRPFYRRQTTCKNSRERRIHRHCWTIFLTRLLSQLRGSIHRLSPILCALILEFNELAVINISDKICCPACPRDS